MNRLIEKLKKSPVIPVLTFDEVNSSLKSCEKLLKDGYTNLEVTLRTKNALYCIEAIAKEFPNACVGAGTIIRKEQFLEVKNAGGSFAVSPGYTKELIDEALNIDIPYLPGASTPSEIIELYSFGFNFQKFFHAKNSGGLKMLKAYAEIFSDIYFCPTGGISQEDYIDYLNLRNVVCVGGSWVVQ